jgi:threonine/homoserine/homoserine lactone efflux protein
MIREGQMDELEPTLGRSLKIWWSFVWRGFLLMLAILVPLEIIFVMFMFPHFPRAGTPPNPADLKRMMVVFPFVWLAGMGLTVYLQALAMRWMLRKAQWSDFRLVMTKSVKP